MYRIDMKDMNKPFKIGDIHGCLRSCPNPKHPFIAMLRQELHGACQKSFFILEQVGGFLESMMSSCWGAV